MSEIPLKFALFWAGNKISLLRYTTFVSLRHFHPESEISLYTTSKWANVEWNNEKQDFNSTIQNQVDISKVNELGIEIKKFDAVSDIGNYAPNYQSDLFRWWWLSNNDGFYLDTDQIILKSFESLDRNCDFIYSAYESPTRSLYCPVGVIGSNKNSKISNYINDYISVFYKESDYNSIGPYMLEKVLKCNTFKDTKRNLEFYYFYPVFDSCLVGEALYMSENGRCNAESLIKALNQSYALHWFGGHPLSQDYNSRFPIETGGTILHELIKKYGFEK